MGAPIPPVPDLVALRDDLDASGADLKVVRPEQFHLTLKFLGEVAEDLVPQLQAALRSAPWPARFRLVLRDVGAFPDWRKMNVVWVGVQDPDGAFGRCYAEVERAFGRFGFEPEGRSFSPHLTLARKRSERGKDRAREVLQSWRDRDFGRVDVSSIRLYRSTLTPQGPLYEPLEEVTLA